MPSNASSRDDPIKLLADMIVKHCNVTLVKAYRIATSLAHNTEQAQQFAKLIENTALNVQKCVVCEGTAYNGRICDICSDPLRDRTKICVVETPVDVIVIEDAYNDKTGLWVYHVLWGRLKAGTELPSMAKLAKRVAEGNIKEVIIALSPHKNDLTPAYIYQICKSINKNINVTMVASGIPVGKKISEVEPETLAESISRTLQAF